MAILGGLGAALSPFLTLSGALFWMTPWFYSFYYYSSFGMVLFLLIFLMGILACVVSVRAAGYVNKMPQRAAPDLKSMGILLVIVGVIAVFNFLVIFSGILILVAGTECDAAWKRIQRARSQTGWPYQTVATAAGNPWTRRISCRFCGAPLTILRASAKAHLVHLETKCPLDETYDTIALPLSRLDSWAPVVADRLHRCEKCGDRTAALIVVGHTGIFTRLQAYCPNGHTNPMYRRIWTPLYPHVAQTPRVDVGFHGRPAPAQFQPTFQQIPPTPVTQPLSISSSKVRVTSDRLSGFCSQCGVKVGASDIYCFRCGHQL